MERKIILMNRKEKILETIEMLARHEEAISELCSAYAERFPEHKELWQSLAREEHEHASWVRKLCLKIDEAQASSDGKRFKFKSVENSLKYLKEQLVRVKEDKELLLLGALSISLDIEKSLLENKYFEVFKSDVLEVKRILQDLENSTKTHLEKVKKVWSETREAERNS